MHGKMLRAGAMLAMLMVGGAQAATTIQIDLAEEQEFIMVPAAGTAQIPITVTVDCLDIVTAVGIPSMDVTVAATGSQDWLTSAGTTITVDAAPCITGLPSLQSSASGNVPVTAGSMAIGMTPQSVALEANGGTASAPVMVEYVQGYNFTADADFPLEVAGGPAVFTATFCLTANAKSMAMWEVTDAADFGSVSGLPQFVNIETPLASGREAACESRTVTYTPPETGAWAEDSYSFKTWSHFIDDGAMKTADQEITWTFVNAGNAAGGDSEDSPGPATALLVLALVGAAAVVARRRQY